MKLFVKLKESLRKTQQSLKREIKRILTRSPKLTGETLEELEAALIAADFGIPMTMRIVDAVREAYETQGRAGLAVFEIAKREVIQALQLDQERDLVEAPEGITVVSLVGVNGTGKTTTAAKLAYRLQKQGKSVLLAACDTFRAAAIEQLQLWGERLGVPVIAGHYHADPAAVAHDALTAAQARGIDYVLVDTAGRLHTKGNLMAELQKVHRVMRKKIPGAPHEVLLVVDANTGTNALIQAREFHRAVRLTGIVLTKLDGTSRGGMAVAIQNELRVPIKFVGVGEQVEDLEGFDPEAYAEGLFGEGEPEKQETIRV